MIGERIVGFREKGHAGVGLINAGFYRIGSQSFFPLEPGKAFSFETFLMPDLANRKKVTGSVIAGDFIDIGIPDDYIKFCKHYSQL
jgi:D-glycero-alpha-D-manno-heptose 1-phosphate guanylyltransferase